LRTPSCRPPEPRGQNAYGSMASDTCHTIVVEAAEGGEHGLESEKAEHGKQKRATKESADRRRGALTRAHEALPHTPPGGKPPETPRPLSLGINCAGRERAGQGYAAPAKGAALDQPSLSPRNTNWDEGKGASGKEQFPVGRRSRRPQQSNCDKCVLTKTAFSWKPQRNTKGVLSVLSLCLRVSASLFSSSISPPPSPTPRSAACA
jgi:hypothetical protein